VKFLITAEALLATVSLDAITRQPCGGRRASGGRVTPLP
jgi:hypothetical protein